ncbi:MAG: N-formylglutamate amidohydrolase [Coriobacteriia bacterium]|nr:N-formylglutamate amidohydrolase [Coriobacteriia bacterium]
MEPLKFNSNAPVRTLQAAGTPLARIVTGEGPVVALALHAGHLLRPELREHIALGDQDRLREEDPHTARMAPRGCTLIEVLRSRFEVDLNRPRFRAVYQGPEDAWGLGVYRDELPDQVDRISRAVYDTFYAEMFTVLSGIIAEHGRFVVLDLHSYNHRRDGAAAPGAPPAVNPEVNLGTGRLERQRWAPVVEGFSAVMNDAGFDCRENVKFRGGHFAHWIAETFPESGAALAIEFKKTYMDEWTGRVDEHAVSRIRSALECAVPVVTAALSNLR